MKRMHLLVFIALAVYSILCSAAGTRIKDLGRLDGWRDNQLIGYGLVTGLAGTGDSPRSKAARQSLSNLLKEFDLSILTDQVQSRNAAIVMVTATLPPFARPGDKLDITVTSAGDARSLLGGVLLLTPLKGADNRVHALAQGPVSVGGYKYDLNGNIVQKNHPTTGAIPAGANVEVGVDTEVVAPNGRVLIVLNSPDYTTAQRVANSINTAGNGARARAADASTIEVDIPLRDRADHVAFLTRMENLEVDPDVRARVIVNERTGTVVSGGDVRISKVAIAQGDLKVSITTENQAVQPSFVSRTGPGIRTELVTNTRVEVNEQNGVTLEAGNTVADLVKALNRIKISTRDMISILQGIKAAGALHADLIIQ